MSNIIFVGAYITFQRLNCTQFTKNNVVAVFVHFVMYFHILWTGFVFGGDVLRLFHGHMDECLTIPEAGSDNEFK